MIGALLKVVAQAALLLLLSPLLTGLIRPLTTSSLARSA